MKIFLTVILIFFCVAFCKAQNEPVQKNKTEREKFDPGRDAKKDIELAIEKTKISGKRIILDVGGEWCIWCHRLDQFFAENDDVNNFMNDNFIVVKVNYSPENKNEKVLSEFPEIPGYPHYFVLDSNGKFLHSQGTGELEKDKGYDKGKIMKFLKKWAPENIKKK